MKHIPLSVLSLAEQVIGVASRLVVYFAVSWLLGAAAQGQFATYLAFLSIVAGICLVALDIANAVLSGEKAGVPRGTLLANTLLASVAMTIATAAILLACWHYDFVTISGDRSFAAALVVSALAMILAATVGGLAIGMAALDVRVMAMLAQSILVLAGLGALWLEGGLSLQGVVWTWALGLLASAVVMYAGVRARIAGPIRADLAIAAKQMWTGLASYGYFACSTIVFRVGVLYVGHFIGAGSTGVFVMAQAPGELLLNLPRAFIALVLSNAANQQGDHVAFLRLVLMALLLVHVLAAPIIYFGLPLVLPAEFGDVGALAVLMQPGMLLLGMGSLAAHHLLGCGKGATASRTMAVGAVLAVVGTAPATALGGLLGAVLMTSAVHAFVGLAMLSQVARLENVSVLTLLSPSPRLARDFVKRVLDKYRGAGMTPTDGDR